MQNKYSVYFRAEGNSKIGLGHIYRCLALAEHLKDEFNLYFIYSHNDNGVEDLIPAYINKIQIPFYTDYVKEAEYIVQNILHGKEILVIDGYNFKTEYQIKIKQKETKTVYIDDIHNFKIVTDVVINHSGGLTPDDFDTDIFTRLYLGPEYAILRKPFIEASNTIKPEPDPGEVFICFGGADPKNYTLSTLKKICSDKKFNFNIITGSAYLFSKELIDYIKQQQLNAHLYNNIDADKMVLLMQQSAKAVTSASTVSYEYLACSRGDLYIVKTADNQQHMYNSLIRSNYAFELHMFQTGKQVCKNEFKINLNNLTNIFRDLQTELELSYRFADIDDLDLYFKWVNDTDVRTQSFNSQPFSYAEHKKWFTNVLQNKDILLFLFKIEQNPVAQVRVKTEHNKATINYSVDANYRGKGIAKAIIKITGKYIFNNLPNVNLIEAFVKTNNVASNKVFSVNRYNCYTDDDKNIFTLSTTRHK